MHYGGRPFYAHCSVDAKQKKVKLAAKRTRIERERNAHHYSPSFSVGAKNRTNPKLIQRLDIDMTLNWAFLKRVDKPCLYVNCTEIGQ